MLVINKAPGNPKEEGFAGRSREGFEEAAEHEDPPKELRPAVLEPSTTRGDLSTSSGCRILGFTFDRFENPKASGIRCGGSRLTVTVYKDGPGPVIRAV